MRAASGRCDLFVTARRPRSGRRHTVQYPLAFLLLVHTAMNYGAWPIARSANVRHKLA